MSFHYVKTLIKDYNSPVHATNNATQGMLHKRIQLVWDFFEQGHPLSAKQISIATNLIPQIEKYRKTSDEFLPIYRAELMDVHSEVLKIHESIREKNENDYQTGYAYQGHRARIKKIEDHARIYPYHFYGLNHQFKLFEERQEEFEEKLIKETNRLTEAYWKIFESNKN